MEFNIDYNQTSPEYFKAKIDELESKFRVKFEVLPDNTDSFGKVGEIGSIYPEWPKDISEAYELFKNHHAKLIFIKEIISFLKKFNSWNERAMKEKLKELEQFISEANSEQITEEMVVDERFHYSGEQGQRIAYRRLQNSFYERNNILQNDLYLDAKLVYGRYFLFKKLLEKKFNIEPEQESEINELKIEHSIEYLTKIFVGLNKKKNRIEVKWKADFIKLFHDANLVNWKPIKWTGSNPELATLIFRLTKKDPIPSLVNKYFEPKNFYDSNSFRGRMKSHAITTILNNIEK